MFRTVVRLSPTFAFSIFGRTDFNQFDHDHINRPESKQPQTGWDRVKLMYRGSETEEISVELNTVVQASLCGAFFGAGIGGFVSSRVAYLNFIENNQATTFKTTAEAKKRLQDYVTVAFAKGAYKWGWRLCFFTGLFSLVSTTISVYRGDTSLIEYVSAGALTGALYKIDMGLAATLVGAGLGTVLSTVAGLTILGILKVTGFSMADLRNALYKLKEAREDQYKQAVAKEAALNDDLHEHHEALVHAKGKTTIEKLD